VLSFEHWLGRRTPAERILRARRFSEDGDFGHAATEAARAAADAAASADDAAAREAADVWLAALAKAGKGDERAVAAERCLTWGVRTRDVLSAASAHAALVARRIDPDALATYVDALEAGALIDAAVRRGVLRVLSVGLYVGMGEAPSRFDGRARLLARLAVVAPSLPFVRLYLGRYEYLRGSFAAASSHLSAVTGSAASSPKVLNLLGRASEKTGDADAAVASYAASLTADRRQAAIHFRLGRLLLARFVDDGTPGDDAGD
jgi:hypothetical protein